MDLYFSPYACSMVVRIVADAAGVAPLPGYRLASGDPLPSRKK